MTARVSSKFKELILGPNSFESIFNGGRIVVYSGAQPASADYAASGTALATITTAGDAWAPNGSAGGLVFTRDGVIVSCATSPGWRMVVSVAGTAGWFRLYGKAEDAGFTSSSAPRVDGAIGTGGLVELVLESTALTAGQNSAVSSFIFTIPPLGA